MRTFYSENVGNFAIFSSAYDLNTWQRCGAN